LKWNKGATEGIIVAGGEGEGKELTQLSHPKGVWVDNMGTVSIVEWGNYRVTQWPKDETRGFVLVGGNGWGNAANQFNCPQGLSFDRRGNMYVGDR
jgi:hypothetical protein